MSNSNIKPEDRHEFESLAELISDNLRWTGQEGAGTSSHDAGMEHWNGTKTYDEAIRLADTGWAQGASRVDALRRELDDAVQALVASKAADMVYDVEGDWADVGRIVTGDPECCGSWSVQGDDRNEKVVKIVANVCVSAAVPVETIFARGAACLAAVDIIESLGRRVELWIGIGLRRADGRQVETHVLVKPASQPAELDRLAFVLCHPAMLRRIAFAHMEIRKHNPGACYPGPVYADDAIVLPELKTGRAPGREENIKQVLTICEMAGIVFNQDDLAGIVGNAI